MPRLDPGLEYKRVLRISGRSLVKILRTPVIKARTFIVVSKTKLDPRLLAAARGCWQKEAEEARREIIR